MSAQTGRDVNAVDTAPAPAGKSRANLPWSITVRVNYHHGNVPADLVQTALRMIEDSGTRDFSLRECAKAVGVDVAAVYRHYPSKDALTCAIAEHGLQELGNRVRRAVDKVVGGGAAERFQAIGHAYVEFAVDRPILYGIVFDRRDPAVLALRGADRSTPSGTCDSAYGMLCTCLDQLVEEGVITPAARRYADITAWAAVHGLAGLLNNGLIRAPKAERARMVEHLCRTVLQGLTRE